MIRIGRSPLRKAPAGRFGPTRIFAAVAPCGGALSGTCFRCGPFGGGSSSGTCACFGAHSSAAGLHPAHAPVSEHTPQRTLIAASRKAGSDCRGRVPFPNVKRMRSRRLETVGA